MVAKSHWFKSYIETVRIHNRARCSEPFDIEDVYRDGVHLLNDRLVYVDLGLDHYD